VRRTSGLLAAALLALAGAAGAEGTAEAGDGAPLLPGLQRIVASGRLVVEVGRGDHPPLVSTDAKGRATGLDVALGRALARALGVRAEILRRGDTVDAVVQRVARREADLGLAFVSRTSERARHVLFSSPYVQQGEAALLHRTRSLGLFTSCPGAADLVQLAHDGTRVGVTRESSQAQWFREADPETKVVTFDSPEDAFAAVKAGKIGIYVEGEIPARLRLQKDPAAAIQLRLCKLGDFVDHIGIAVRPDAPDLLRFVDVFLAENGVSYDAQAVVAHEGPWEFGAAALAPRDPAD